MEILLDTNFILTCVKQKIDFVNFANEIINEKIEWIIPFEVVGELTNLSTRKNVSGKDKDSAKLALFFIENIKYESMRVNNKNVDQGILDFARGKNIVLATMDKKLKNDFGGRILTIRDLRGLELIS